MRVVQLVHSQEPGGVATIAAEIGAGLTRAGFEVATLYLFPHPRAGAARKIAGTAKAALALVRDRPDAVFAYQSTGSILAGVVGALTGCRFRVVHQTAMPGEVRPLLRWIDRVVGTLGFYSANVVNSGATQAAFRGYPRAYRRKLVRIDHGVPPPVPTRSRAETWSSYGIPAEDLILLNVGRLTAQKNQDVLVRALARLPQARLVVAGGGPRREVLENLAASLGVSSRVHLLGDVAREDMADLYGAGDIFVFPSLWETFGLAAVEAALAGLPVVASDLDVLREVLRDHEPRNAFVAPDDVQGWVTLIQYVGSRLFRATPRSDLLRSHSPNRMMNAYCELLRLTGRA